MSATATETWKSSWSLWFHDPKNTSWVPSSYVNLGTFNTFEPLFGTLKTIGSDTLARGMYFLMRDPFFPDWNNHKLIRGGCYSIQVPERLIEDTLVKYMCAGVKDVIANNSANEIIGVTVSPKKQFHILKLWNLNAEAFNLPSDIKILSDHISASDIMYKRNVNQNY